MMTPSPTHSVPNIAFDGKRALFNHTGLGNYSRYAIEAISGNNPDSICTLFTAKAAPEAMESWLGAHPRLRVVSRQSGEGLAPLWRHYGGLTAALRREKPDIYHGLSNELPLDIAKAGIPTVVTIHDLIFRRIPDNYKPLDRLLYDFKFRRSAAAATRVIAISERTKADIMELYDIDPDKIDVIYQGCNPLFTRPVNHSDIAEVKRLYDLPERYIIMVGTVEQRKNQLLAIEALPSLPDDVGLIIVGRERNDYGRAIASRIDALRLGSRVKSLTGVPTAHLPALYAQATMAAYPSRYEGFGLPVVEAISSGTPVIAATGSCLEEAGGPGAIYIDPDSPRQFAEAASAILTSQTLRATMVADGRRHTARFDAATFASQVNATYARAIREFHTHRGQ